jgi:threonine dehydrogenase-like Zn-dependent dehydrogenase
MKSDFSISALDGRLEYPLAFGYALVGCVEDIGAEVEEEWLGRRVFAFHPHATHAAVPVDDVMPVPRACSAVDAALYPSVETAVNFAHDGNPRLGERVVVLGQGIVGLMTTAVLARHPVECLVTVDRYARRRQLSKQFGASASFHPGGGAAAMRRAFASTSDDRGADLTYELSGNPKAINAALEISGYGATVVLGSWYGTKTAPLDLGGSFHRSRIKLVSSQVSTIDPVLRGRWDKSRRSQVAWRLLTELQPASSVVTHRFPIGRAGEAYQMLAECPEKAVQVVFTYA